MCGISGYYGEEIISKPLIKKTLNLMKNRGPDDQNYKFFKYNLKKVFLLSSRLKIVDRLDRSNQPMEIEDCIISFNGEIYNIGDLRKKVLKNGLKLKTKSDTELILKMYKIFGTNCVNHFDGMWAFAIFDKKRGFLFISRDRLGEKPFYIYKKSNGYYFGSETKFIRSLLVNYRDLNNEKIYRYLKFGYKSIEQDKESFFKNIFKIEPGTNVIIKDDLSLKKNRYWKPSINENNFTENKCKKLIKENFETKIKSICNTDLKLGLSLSGGIDSNYILGYITKFLNKKVNTYSIVDKKNKKYDEERLIDIAVKNSNIKNHKIYLSNSKKNFLNLRKLINYHDKPVSTISLFLQSLIYKKMKDDGVKICVSGNGADELFAGYYHHYNLYYNSIKSDRLKSIFKNKWESEIYPLLRNKEYKSLTKKNLQSYFTLLNDDYLNLKGVKMFKDKAFSKNLLRNKLLNELTFQTVPLALNEDDLNSMYYSIENRSPFLNKDLVEISFKIPTKHLMKDSYNKYLLRLSSKNIMNEKIRLNREKKGFNANFNSVFSFENNDFKEWFFDKDSKNPIYNFLNKKFFINNFRKNSSNFFSDMSTQALFNICSVKIFLEETAS